MSRYAMMRGLLGSCALVAIMPALGLQATAQEEEVITTSEADAGDDTARMDLVVTTGSRIKREVASTPAPVTSVGEQAFDDRGFVTAADALNDITSLNPDFNQAAGDGSASGSGQQFPELFGLGAGRTLTLVNGRRMVTSSSGLGDAQVDANIIPTGLIERIEVVQAGGAAVYGSDAIAGVINYILKDDFEGFEADVQFTEGENDAYNAQSARITAGTNFDNGRGNAAFNFEMSKSPLLRFSDLPVSNRSRITQSNSADTGPNDGIPSVSEVMPAYFWNFNGNGVVFTAPAPPPNFLARVNGSPVQFSPDGSIIPYDPGNILGIPFAEGGQGTRYSDLAGLRTGVDRMVGNAIGHYDLTPNLRLNWELLYADTQGESVPQGYVRTVLNQTDPALGAILFTRNNPFLTQDAIDSLSQANPGFAFGAPLWLSRNFYNDLFPSNVQENKTETWRGMAELEGDFDAGDRNFYWTVSGSYSEVLGEQRAWDANVALFNQAIQATRDVDGNIVCAINADNDPSNDDPNCAPLNPFGAGNISQAASEYVSVRTGSDFENTQIDFLATIGTELFQLPAGGVDAVLAYEHRREEASFTPLRANQLGLTGTGTLEKPTSGEYNTNELSVEVLVPIVGGDFTLPLVQELELSGTYRFVDNSIAGEESVWSLGTRWEPVDGVTVRATRSRNFRAPTLTQLFAPTTVTVTNAGNDPCDADRINAGPNPAVRRANCEAEWAANPQYGDLATFQDPAENFSIAAITSGGNPNLENEVSETTTYGIVLDQLLVPGLTFSADRIEIDLEDGLSAFSNEDFMATCYDSTSQPADICSVFTRLQAADGSNPAGTVISGRSTTFNAGQIVYRGEVYYLNYQFDTSFGDISLGLEATHTSELSTSVTGTTFNRTDNTVAQPDWAGKINAVYSTGPLRLTYQLNYLDEVKAREGATIENNPNPVIDSNITHSVSALYSLDNGVTFRAGIKNLTDEEPSYPTLVHGDILGRRYFAGMNIRF
ncbi:TonB-dependent receptor domain-containing protein [Henriciella litoralis]|uniref:TonB-dependent receptor domain-containing protein n=1 Tax=Henriciella litoralis TaxID=568102 RepID=UPI000A019ACE|nr:TonB-dependent receptor [Henriciella litoralis]